MKKIAFTGIYVVAFAIITGSVMTGCNSYFGSAGPTGIDTIGALKRGLIDMTTSDSTLVPALNSPANLTTAVIVSPILTWHKVGNASKYQIVLATDSGFNNVVIDDSSLSSAADTVKQVYALTGTSTYYWCVAGMNAAGKKGWSRIFHFVTKFDSSLIKEQNAYVAQQFGMFIHFNMSTFAHWDTSATFPAPTAYSEWEVGGENVNLFHPDSLNCGQWADVAKSAGCRYVVLTTRHHGGFCLWPTQVPPSATNHNIALTNWYNNGGGIGYHRDILREFVDSVRSRGLKPGFLLLNMGPH